MQLIFLHIPKAGGSTFHDMLERYYDKSTIFDKDIKGGFPVADFIKLSEIERNKFKLLKGHMKFGMHKYCNSEIVKYITILRNPVDRVISHYYYAKNNPYHYLYNDIKNKNISLVDYVSRNMTNETENGQTQLLTACEGVCNHEHFELAKKNIQKHFITFGIMEYFDESMILFKNILKWEAYPFYLKQNEGRNKKENDVTEEVISIIMQKNHYDIELYNWAVKIFSENIALIPEFNNELDILTQMNRAIISTYEIGYKKGCKDNEKTTKEHINIAIKRIYKKFTS